MEKLTWARHDLPEGIQHVSQDRVLRKTVTSYIPSGPTHSSLSPSFTLASIPPVSSLPWPLLQPSHHLTAITFAVPVSLSPGDMEGQCQPHLRGPCKAEEKLCMCCMWGLVVGGSDAKLARPQGYRPLQGP